MRRVAVMAFVVMAVAVSAGAQFVAPGGTVPVVASIPGLNNTDWRTDVSVVNLAGTETSVLLLLQPEIANGAPTFDPILSDPVNIAAGDQRTFRNIVETFFGLSNTKGALSVFSDDGAPLVVSARIYTLDDDGGSYGQNVEGVLVKNSAWAAGIAHDEFYRTNFGIYLPFNPPLGQTTRFVVSAFDREGEQVGTADVFFGAAGVQQRSLNALGVQGLLDGYLEIRCLDPSVAFYAYASRVDQISGDAVFRQAKGRQSDLP